MTDENDTALVVTFRSLTAEINKPVVSSGRMPLNSNECLLDDNKFDETAIGSKIIISEFNDKDTLGCFREKEYVVTVDKPLTTSICHAMEQGVPILDTMTRPCKITDNHQCSFHMILTQGLNRQIRRMCEYFGYRVRKLHRIRIMNIRLDDLPEGKWRYLSDKEIMILKKQAGQKGKDKCKKINYNA